MTGCIYYLSQEAILMKNKFFQQMLRSLGFAHVTPHTAESDLILGFHTDSLSMEATVDQPICPGQSGRIRFQASWWPARCQYPVHLKKGSRVKIIGRDNITLLVEPLSWPACDISLPLKLEAYRPALNAIELVELRN
jgi:hypothetical protein